MQLTFLSVFVLCQCLFVFLFQTLLPLICGPLTMPVPPHVKGVSVPLAGPVRHQPAVSAVLCPDYAAVPHLSDESLGQLLYLITDIHSVTDTSLHIMTI